MVSLPIHRSDQLVENCHIHAAILIKQEARSVAALCLCSDADLNLVRRQCSDIAKVHN